MGEEMHFARAWAFGQLLVTLVACDPGTSGPEDAGPDDVSEDIREMDAESDQSDADVVDAESDDAHDQSDAEAEEGGRGDARQPLGRACTLGGSIVVSAASGVMALRSEPTSMGWH